MAKEINKVGFVKAFVRTKGNMSVKDFLDNGYTMEHFIQFATATINYKSVFKTYEREFTRLAKMGDSVAAECLMVLLEDNEDNETIDDYKQRLLEEELSNVDYRG